MEGQVLAWIDANSEQIVKFLQDLIRIPSVNSWFDCPDEERGEGDAQRFIAEYMKKLGAEVELWEPDVQRLEKYSGQPGHCPGHEFQDRPNLAATVRGAGGGRSLLLMGHIDTVKPGANWTTDPYGGEIREGDIYGRGTVDMKGGIVAMIAALEAIVRSGVKLNGSVCVGTVVDEESGGMGALDFIDMGYRADGCIMTEATSLKIAPLCRGILWGTITIEGRSGHIELPQGDWRNGQAVDAIAKARMLLDQIDWLNRDWALRKVHPLLKIPCQINVGQIVAGEYPSTFANRAEISFDAQFLPSECDQYGGGGVVQKEIEEFVHAVAQTDPWLREHPPVVEWVVNADCAETPADHPFVQTCAESLERIGQAPEMEGSYFHTDMGWPCRVGIPTINFGPGNPADAHQDDERVPIDELIQATKMIALSILSWCGVQENGQQ